MRSYKTLTGQNIPQSPSFDNSAVSLLSPHSAQPKWHFSITFLPFILLFPVAGPYMHPPHSCEFGCQDPGTKWAYLMRQGKDPRCHGVAMARSDSFVSFVIANYQLFFSCLQIKWSENTDNETSLYTPRTS